MNNLMTEILEGLIEYSYAHVWGTEDRISIPFADNILYIYVGESHIQYRIPTTGDFKWEVINYCLEDPSCNPQEIAVKIKRIIEKWEKMAQ